MILKDNSSSISLQSGVTSLTWSHTVNAGQNLVLYVFFMHHVYTVAPTATYGGVAMTRLAEREDAVGENKVVLFVLVNPAVGTASVVITANGTVDAFGTATSWFGVDQLNPNRTLFTAVWDGTTPSQPTCTVTDAASGDVCIDGFCSYNQNGTVGAGQTELFNSGTTALALRGGTSYENATGSTVMSWTMTNTYWGQIATALVPALVRPPTPFELPRNVKMPMQQRRG